MLKGIIAQNERIVMGVDIHDRSHQVCVATAEGVELRNIAVPGSKRSWHNLLRKFPDCRITVLYEAGGNGYSLHDYITAKGHECVVVTPEKHLGPKTDRRDARAIARDYLAGRTRHVTVPRYSKRVDRQILRTRHQLKDAAKKLKNQLKSMEKFHGLDKKFGTVDKDKRGYLAHLQKQYKKIIEYLQEQAKGLEGALKMIAKEDGYKDQVEALEQIKGVGTMSAMEMMLDIADITQFKTSKAAASYTGLCPNEYSSGDKRRQGRITRRGPGRLRAMLVQCAWVRVRYDQDENRRYCNLKNRIGSKKAIVAIARRLMVLMWWKLKELAPPETPVTLTT